MISVRNLSLRAGTFALDNISFDVPQRAYAVLRGRTGTGKTMLLEAIAGLRRPLSGAICLGGIDVTALPPAQRGIGYVPQDRVLFSTMSVQENIGFSLSIRKRPREEIDRRVNDLAAMLGIAPICWPQAAGAQRRRSAAGGAGPRPCRRSGGSPAR